MANAAELKSQSGEEIKTLEFAGRADIELNRNALQRLCWSHFPANRFAIRRKMLWKDESCPFVPAR